MQRPLRVLMVLPALTKASQTTTPESTTPDPLFDSSQHRNNRHHEQELDEGEGPKRRFNL